MKKTPKILSNLLLIFSVLLLCYVFYRSEFYYLESKISYYLRYYLISFFLIILSIVSYFIDHKIKVKITMLLVSTSIGLYLSEGILTLRYINSVNTQEKLFQEVIKKSGIKYDTRTRIQAYDDSIKNNMGL